jgi:hypothetical protein
MKVTARDDASAVVDKHAAMHRDQVTASHPGLDFLLRAPTLPELID